MDKLTEPILEDGFSVIDYFNKINTATDFEAMILQLKGDLRWFNHMPFLLTEKLKEWHFNIYDLPKEMYIEKSTLKA